MAIENRVELLHSLLKFQEKLKGEAERAGLKTEEDVDAWITESRRNENTPRMLHPLKSYKPVTY